MLLAGKCEFLGLDEPETNAFLGEKLLQLFGECPKLFIAVRTFSAFDRVRVCALMGGCCQQAYPKPLPPVLLI